VGKPQPPPAATTIGSRLPCGLAPCQCTAMKVLSCDCCDSPCRWSFSEQAGWDLIAVYYGEQKGWSCPEVRELGGSTSGALGGHLRLPDITPPLLCVLVPPLQCTLALHMPDAMKWQMIWALMTEAEPRWRGIWQGIRESYDYIMVADDDLIMDACTIDIFFDVRLVFRRLQCACQAACAGGARVTTMCCLSCFFPLTPCSPCGGTSCWRPSPPTARAMTATTPTGELSRPASLGAAGLPSRDRLLQRPASAK
jgi:hypothetical protein